MDALLKEIADAKKRLPKSKSQLKVLERLLEQSTSQSTTQSTTQGGTSQQWKKVEGTRILSKEEQVEQIQNKSLLKLEKLD